MLPLAHVGLPLLAATWPPLRRAGLDLRAVAVGGLLPDLLDKGLLLALGSGTGKALGHALVLTLALLAAGFALRGGARVVLLGLGFGTGSHLVLDMMWVEHDALLWPLFGWEWARYPFTPSRALLDAVRDPVHLAGEIAGAASLAFLAWRHGPGAFRRIVATGGLGQKGREDPPGGAK